MTNVMTAPKSAYGICVKTCVIGEHAAPCVASTVESLKKQAWLPTDNGECIVPMIDGM